MALGGSWVAPRRSWDDLSGSRDDLGSALGALGLSPWDLRGSGVVLGVLLGIPGGIRGVPGADLGAPRKLWVARGAPQGGEAPMEERPGIYSFPECSGPRYPGMYIYIYIYIYIHI